MKKVGVLLLLLFFVGIGVLFLFQKKDYSTKQVLPASVVVPTEMLKPSNSAGRQVQHDKNQIRDDNNQGKTFLFVPYWGQTAERIPDSYGNALIYFGVVPNKNGIDVDEDGYMGLARFEAISEGRETFLTLRMIDQDISFAILKDKKLQEKIIVQSIEIAKQYRFKGVVLDLEISSLPFASITDQMNNFVKDFSASAKKDNLSFSMVFFGDTFYRLRPYDIAVLRQYIDAAFVMAYDFSKAKQDPGPNFPFNGKDKYGYDFTVMVEDFLNVIPKEKLMVVFGMFGYDWMVDSQGVSTKQAEARTLTVAKKQFLNRCLFNNCSVKRDELSAETTVSYVDNEGENHIVWFEDEESVAKKREFLKEKGINSIGYWAYSYY